MSTTKTPMRASDSTISCCRACKALPGVTHVALTSNLPGLGAAHSDIEIEHSTVNDPAHRPSVSFVVQSPGYFDAINLPILLGRDFNETDGTANHKAAFVTRECAEHFWPGQSAIGKRFRFYDDKNKPGDWITVIGVSANIVQELNEKSPNPLMFVPLRQEGWNGMALLIRSSGNPIAAVRAAVQNLDQDLPLRDVYTLPQAMQHQQWYLHLFSKLFSGFALIALVMAAVGIYAVLAQATNSRTQEIGVRMALGANARNIIALVMRRGLWQIVAGLGAWSGRGLSRDASDGQPADRRLSVRSDDLRDGRFLTGDRRTACLLDSSAQGGSARSGQGDSIRVEASTCRLWRVCIPRRRPYASPPLLHRY